MNTHETYVSLEVAKLLKQAGFDWDVQSYYSKLSRTQGRLLWLSCGCRYGENINTNQNRYSAPTLDVAQRWLREVKGIEVYAHVFYDSRDMLNECDVYVYEVNHITKHIEDYISSYEIYHTYEEAQDAGIKKVLELILEKKE